MTEATTPATEERLGFQAEVARLLDIVAHSLYSDRRIFLRELISNASDACDRLRYAAITQPELTTDDPEFRIVLSVDKGNRRLTIADNGIGMNREDLVANLGTIARSGTAAFVAGLSGDARKDVPLIGQFGVGFYSAFMVAERVEVVSRKAGEAQAWRWTSDGKGSFTIAPAERRERGTAVTIALREDAAEFLDPGEIGAIVRQYSDHIALPIILERQGGARETLNRGQALWARPRSEVTAEQYREFYHHAAHASDDPWLTLHWRAEGKIDYSGLLFVPTAPPFDLYLPERRHGIKLYVRRVFITDTREELAPRYLRFLRGVIDSDDLPLNISREMLQHNPVLALIRSGIVNRVLGDLEKKAKDAGDEYLRFWQTFGAVLKEGLYEDHEHRDRLLGLARFRSVGQDGWIGLADYVARTKPGQDAIFYIAGEDAKQLVGSPQLEGYKKRGVDVLLFTDPVDEFWVGTVGAYQRKPFRSVTRGATDLAKIPVQGGDGQAAPTAEPPAGEIGALVALFRLTLQDAVKDVRTSERLTESPVCLVADEQDLDIHLERFLRQHKQIDSASKRILEINPHHELIRALAGEVSKPGAGDRLADAAHLLLDQARLMEGEPMPDPAGFARRMNSALVRALAAGP